MVPWYIQLWHLLWKSGLLMWSMSGFGPVAIFVSSITLLTTLGIKAASIHRKRYAKLSIWSRLDSVVKAIKPTVWSLPTVIALGCWSSVFGFAIAKQVFIYRRDLIRGNALLVADRDDWKKKAEEHNTVIARLQDELKQKDGVASTSKTEAGEHQNGSLQILYGAEKLDGLVIEVENGLFTLSRLRVHNVGQTDLNVTMRLYFSKRVELNGSSPFLWQTTDSDESEFPVEFYSQGGLSATTVHRGETWNWVAFPGHTGEDSIDEGIHAMVKVFGLSGPLVARFIIKSSRRSK
jgi:hypothetical protein